MDEQQLISLFSDLHPKIGDDCAALEFTAEQSFISTDTYAENIHFDLVHFNARDVASKAFHSSCSDLIAMSARPTQMLLNLSIPPDFEDGWIIAFADELNYLCEQYGVAIIGGDTTASRSGVVISSTVIGVSGKPTRRKTAKVGDLICISKPIGGSFCGFHAISNRINYPGIDAHLRPHAEFCFLENTALVTSVTSMMDLTDGLMNDLPKLVPDHLGFQIDIDNVPLCDSVMSYCHTQDINACDMAVVAAEDLALLYTIKPEVHRELSSSFGRSLLDQCFVVGKTTENRSVRRYLWRSNEYIATTLPFKHFQTSP